MICLHSIGLQRKEPSQHHVERGELLRLADLCTSPNHEVSIRGEKQLRSHISNLPTQQKLAMLKDANQQIRVQAIKVTAIYFRTHVNQWCQVVTNAQTNTDRCTLMNTFEAHRFSERDLISYLTICHSFRKTEDRVLRIAVIESMGRAKVKTKEHRDLVVSVLGIYTTDGGHKDDRTKAFTTSHRLAETNPF